MSGPERACQLMLAFLAAVTVVSHGRDRGHLPGRLWEAVGALLLARVV